MNTERGNEVQPGEKEREREKNEVTVRERRERERERVPGWKLSLCHHFHYHYYSAVIYRLITLLYVLLYPPTLCPAGYLLHMNTSAHVKRVFGCTSVVKAVRLVTSSEQRAGSVVKVEVKIEKSRGGVSS